VGYTEGDGRGVMGEIERVGENARRFIEATTVSGAHFAAVMSGMPRVYLRDMYEAQVRYEQWATGMLALGASADDLESARVIARQANALSGPAVYFEVLHHCRSLYAQGMPVREWEVDVANHFRLPALTAPRP
jgi:hypothetical protein